MTVFIFFYNDCLPSCLIFQLDTPQVLSSVCRALGYRSVKSFVNSHLYYLVTEWLGQKQTDNRYTLESFPYTLLNHNTLQEFYRYG